MQLVIISSPGEIANEAKIINALFEEGLERFHLRKPNCNEAGLMRLLDKIKPENYPKIAFHQLHHVALKNGFKRIHFKEAALEQMCSEELETMRTDGCILSTSLHTLTGIRTVQNRFEYAFYGPVFESISKPGYKPGTDSIPGITKDKNRSPEIIAIGGIDASRLQEIAQAGYDGAALLGTIWQDTARSIQNFKRCLKNANTY